MLISDEISQLNHTHIRQCPKQQNPENASDQLRKTYPKRSIYLVLKD